MFFEDVIRENLDLGRPDDVQRLFDRKIISIAPGRFRTRVVTDTEAAGTITWSISATCDSSDVLGKVSSNQNHRSRANRSVGS
jgi:hypothetical protein